MTKKQITNFFLYSFYSILFFFVCLSLVFVPSHDRDWEFGQERLPHILFKNDGLIKIENFRDFDWKKEGIVKMNYITKEFNFTKLNSVDVFISHFDNFEGLAHIFLSFGFEGGEHVVVSLEARRESNEEFSPILGVLRQFEIIYVVGSERDVIGLRTNVRGERVYLYPIKATPEQAKEYFKLIAEDINAIYEKPRIYNTFTHNCVNELTRRAEKVSGIDFPISLNSILPGYFDKVLYDLNIISTKEDFNLTKKHHFVQNTLVNKEKDTFEYDLRKNLPEYKK
jgi:hypothetical protein